MMILIRLYNTAPKPDMQKDFSNDRFVFVSLFGSCILLSESR